ncbi:hypothetical protein ACWGDX_30480 [Streptomyces sp. NPDC055025]
MTAAAPRPAALAARPPRAPQTAPLRIRAAGERDRQRFEDILNRRLEWERRRRRPREAVPRGVLALLSYGRPGPAVMALTDEGTVLAFMVLSPTPPADDGWSEADTAAPAWYLTQVCTDPHRRYRSDRLALLMTYWAGDHAARLHPAITSIRCSVRDSRLAQHLQDTSGWTPLRDTGRDSGAPRLLHRRPRQLPGLGALLTGPAGPLIFA